MRCETGLSRSKADGLFIEAHTRGKALDRCCEQLSFFACDLLFAWGCKQFFEAPPALATYGIYIMYS